MPKCPWVPTNPSKTNPEGTCMYTPVDVPTMLRVVPSRVPEFPKYTLPAPDSVMFLPAARGRSTANVPAPILLRDGGKLTTGIAGYPVMYRTSLPADPLMPYQASGAVPSI